MKGTIKRALSLVLLASTLLALLMLSSCGGTKGAIEDFLTSDNYTVQMGDITVKADGATIYVDNKVTSTYLYYSKEEKSYFYCEQILDGIINKKALDSEEYIVYHGQLVSGVANATERLTAFLQIADMLEPVEGVYTVENYTVSEKEGTITCEIDKVNSIIITNVGSTVIEIPEAVNSAIAK